MYKNFYLAILLLIIVMIIPFIYYSNNSITVTNINIENENIDNKFNILHLSDIHGKVFGKENEKIKEKIGSLNYDIVVITGDLIDSRRANNITETVKFVKHLASNKPVYYVEGNHEYALEKSKYNQLADELSKIEDNFYFLKGDHETITINGNTIKILGVATVFTEYDDNLIINDIDDFNTGDEFKLILDHFPLHFDIYENSKLNYDLVLSGHAHGGQIRLPFIGGLFSPGEGFNPKYTSGVYNNKKGKMIVSRGLGNSLFPLRVFNRPQIVLIEVS